MRKFDAAWQFLAKLGHCDDLGGAEYRRVLKEWVNAGKPKEITAFIRHRANVPSVPQRLQAYANRLFGSRN